MVRWDVIDVRPAVCRVRQDQEVESPVVAVAKAFAAGTRTGKRSDARGQLLSVTAGLMVAMTDTGTWMVPAGHALWLPAGISHDVAMHGDVVTSAVYVARDAARTPAPGCRVIVVTPLLEAAIGALAGETGAYDGDGRGGHLAALVLDEIGRAEIAPFVLPVPADRRLARLARALIGDPGLSHGLDDWCLALGMSRRSLTRQFRLETGLSVGAWLRRLRLVEAAARQADGEPAARIAAGLGYRSRSAFRAMVRREAARGAGPASGRRRP